MRPPRLGLGRSRRRRSYRPSPGGSIAACTAIVRSGTPDGTLVPPFTGRLHCGGKRWPGAESTPHLVPPFTGRLHCGVDIPLQTFSVDTDSYRPSPGGSIAARMFGSTLRHLGRLVPPFTGRLHCGHRRRAVVRHSGRTRTALHRAAPLRRRPVYDAGCPDGPSYRPSPGGSIAASEQPGRGRWSRPLVPPFTGRLHCGSSHPPGTRTRGRPRLVPPFTGRLHCGCGAGGSSSGAELLVPPFTGRLHCGRRHGAEPSCFCALAPPFTERLNCNDFWRRRGPQACCA